MPSAERSEGESDEGRSASRVNRLLPRGRCNTKDHRSIATVAMDKTSNPSAEIAGTNEEYAVNISNRFRVKALVACALAEFIGNPGIPASAAAAEPTRVAFDPANFVDPRTSTNEYHPLRPGMQWIRGGTTEVGSRKVPHQVISTMTDVGRMIDGVQVIAMLDQSTDSGEIAQVGFDYFGLDKDRNVWIMGGYTENFEGGVFTDVDNASLGTATGGQPGILLPGVVTMDTPRWFIGTPGPDEAPSVAEPVQVGITTTVAFGEFQNVIAIREGGIDAVDNEIKYYAPGVGVIFNDPKVKSLHQDSFELINLIELSSNGLAEASQVVLDLEKHARTVASKVYGDVPVSERMK